MRIDDISTDDAAEALHELGDDDLFDVLAALLARRYWLDIEAKSQAIVSLERALIPGASPAASETPEAPPPPDPASCPGRGPAEP